MLEALLGSGLHRSHTGLKLADLHATIDNEGLASTLQCLHVLRATARDRLRGEAEGRGGVSAQRPTDMPWKF